MPGVLTRKFSILYHDDSHITNENDNPELAHLTYVHSIIPHNNFLRTFIRHHKGISHAKKIIRTVAVTKRRLLY